MNQTATLCDEYPDAYCFPIDMEFDSYQGLMELVARHSNDAVVITDVESSESIGPRILYVNEAFERITGYSQDEMLGQTIQLLRGPETDPDTCDWIRAKMRESEGFRCEILNYRKDGSSFWLEIDVQPAVDYNGRFSNWISIQRDVTERKVSEERLRRSEEHCQRLISTSTDCIKTLDLNGRIVTINESGAAILNATSPTALIGQDWLKYLIGEARATVADAMNRAKRGETIQIQIHGPTPNGTPKWWDIVLTPLLDEAGIPELLLAVSRDVTILHDLLEQQKLLLAEANDRARRDSLTGLYNYRVFHDALHSQAARALENGSSLAVLELDIDNFKAFNDAYGHLAGDNAITQVATLLKRCSTEMDALRADLTVPDDAILASRVGGDEFAILLPNATREDAMRLATDLKDGVDSLRYEPRSSEDNFATGDSRTTFIPFKISIGVALFPDDAATAVEAYRIADQRALQDKIGSKSYGNHELRERLKSEFDGFSMLDALVAAVDNRDRYTRRHSEDVLYYALAIADELELAEADRKVLTLSALIHDVGKICVPDRILRQPGGLSHEDYEKMQQHVTVSAALVGSMPALIHTLPAVRHHHERWDGDGYPDKLAGENIPLLARVLAVADAFTAMTADRPYRRGMTAAEAAETLKKGAGRQWDPRCVGVLVQDMSFHAAADLLR